MKSKFDIYLVGVGGQGIGLLSEALMRAIDHAGIPVKAVDTHGLAQRGGTVQSYIRMGTGVFTPLIQKGAADLVVSLERHEAMRGLIDYLADGGALVYYDAVWQPLSTRLRKEKSQRPEEIAQLCDERNIREIRVFVETLPDPRMQNIAVLAKIAQQKLLGGVLPTHYEQALADLLDGTVLERNLELFRRVMFTM